MLKEVQLKAEQAGHYPFNIQAIRNLGSLQLSQPVTFFVGDNGTGKSTVLEAIAVAARAITIGSESVTTDRSLNSVRLLAEKMKLIWDVRTTAGFFLRAEDFFSFVKKQEQMRQELEQSLKQIDEDYKGRSAFAKQLASMPYMRELYGIRSRYGNDLDAHSHGETYLKVLNARIKPRGLYLLDEPEAALSPMSQFSLIVTLLDAAKEGAQFIIATHSPIILSYPDARIYSFTDDRIESADYQTLEHVRFTRSFLQNPEAYLRHLGE